MSTPEEDIEASLRDEIRAEAAEARTGDEQTARAHRSADGRGPEQNAAPVPAGLTGVVKPLATLGMVLAALLGLNAVASLAGIWANFLHVQLLETPTNGESLGGLAWIATGPMGPAVDGAEERGTTIAILSVALLLVTGVVYLVWVRRAYGNLSAFDYERKYGLGWSIGAWFVPLLNLYRPFVIIKEIYCASDPQRSFGDAVRLQAPFVMYAWWGSLMLSRGVDRFHRHMDMDTFPQILAATRFAYVPLSAAALFAVLAALVVHRTTKRQTALIERLTSTGRPTTF